MCTHSLLFSITCSSHSKNDSLHTHKAFSSLLLKINFQIKKKGRFCSYSSLPWTVVAQELGAMRTPSCFFISENCILCRSPPVRFPDYQSDIWLSVWRQLVKDSLAAYSILFGLELDRFATIPLTDNENDNSRKMKGYSPAYNKYCGSLYAKHVSDIHKQTNKDF